MFALLIPLLANAYAGKMRTPDVVEDALAFAQADRSKAIALLESSFTEARRKEAGMIALHAGEQRRLAGDLEQAQGWFEKALASEPELETAVTVGRLLIQSTKGLSKANVAVLADAHHKSLLATQNADRHMVLAFVASQENDASGVKDHTKRALDAAKADKQQYSRIKAQLEALAGGEPTAIPTGSSAGSPMERARMALAEGNLDRARKAAEQALAEAQPDSLEARRAAYMIQRIDKNVPVRPDHIVVLLPQSGKYQMIGKQMQEAFEYGFKREMGKAQLTFVDSGGTPEAAVAAVEKAVLDEGAIAVAGPLLSSVVEQVTETADALEVPLLSISQSNEIEDNPWIYQAVPSVGDQVEALVEHVMTVDGRKKFGIFAPDSDAGKRSSELFRAEVEERGGSITGETYYDPTATALMPFAAEFGNKDVKARAWELRKLREEAEEAGHDPSKVVLPPDIELDAIFIPDHARNVTLAAAALAYEEFSIGQFRARDDEPMAPLLGLSGWNRDSLVTSGNEYVRDSRFTEIFDPEAHKDFVGAYKEATGREPTPLEAAMVDAARLLGAATRAGATTREDFAAKLAETTIEASNTGTPGFDEHHRVDPKVQILTIDYKGIQPVE